MADYYVDDRRDYDRSRGSNWAWLLLLPLFFFGGWLLNDAFDRNPTNTGPQAGVGGAPFEEDNTRVSPSLREDSSTTVTSPTPTVSGGLDYGASGGAE